MAIHWTKTYPLRPARSLHQRSQLSTEKYLVSVYPELKLAERLVEKYKGQLQVYKSNKKPVQDGSIRAYVAGGDSDCFLSSVESRAHEKTSPPVELQTDG
ncbi:hypothetical protein E4U45_007516 [Claviceps purpurea]|nr:hypothetical protein E4U45_007516 [Claviceps purpurea]